jgi:aminomethyltransferase
MTVNAETGYRAARQGAVVIDRAVEGRVRATGRDRLDLLQRMSTQDMIKLAPGQAAFTVLTTPLARIVDRLWVLGLADSNVWITGPGRALAVRKWLSGYIFFRDEVKLSDASTELGQLGLYGAGAAQVAEALLPGAAGLAANALLEHEGLIIARGRPLAGDGFTVLAPADRIAAVWAAAEGAGAVPAGDDTYDLLRLAAGQPAAGHELTEDYIPLELALWDSVSFSKGCYIGQEIIARMESRGKLARRLVGLRLAGPVERGAPVRVAEREVGAITSTGVLPDQGPVALTVLKTAHAEPGTRVAVGAVAGEVVGLPFG